MMICMSFVSVACSGSASSRYIQVDGAALGTFVHVIACTDMTAEELAREIERIDAEAKSSMSIFDENSRLSRLNDNRTDSVDRHIAFNIALARRFHDLSEGRYDVTVKPLTEAWGFVRKQPDRSVEPDLDSLLQFVGMDKIAVEGERLVKSDARVQLDFNSIAKGYVVDMVGEMLESHGCSDYIVDIGGEVRCKGRNREGDKWRVGIETPYDGNEAMDDIQRIISVTDAAVATSGNYRRFWYDDKGRKIAHTIDPRTGRSAVSQLLSVTVVAPTCAEADAAGTMLLAAGSDDAEALAEELDGMLVYFIFAGEAEDEYRVVCSDGLEEMFADAQ